MRNQIKRLLTGVVGSVITIILITACSSEDVKNAKLEVRLTDAPGNYEEVNVDIQGVEIHANEGEQTTGWQSLTVKPGVYNLLQFTNGLDTLLGSIELPATGRVSQIRLILGSKNTIKVNGQIFDLNTPSAQQSGLKINVQAQLSEGITYTILLDFDVARSIIKTGNNKYILKPVIRAITEATSGSIKGTVSKPESTPAIYAILDADTVGTSFADANGKFLLKGLPQGTYTVKFAPKTGYTISDKTNVDVSIGVVTDLGTVTVN